MRKTDERDAMAGVRSEIDRLDAELVRLLAERTACIDRAVEIKRATSLPARIETRVDAVLDNVRSHARRHGLPEDFAEKLWRELIEWSIAREETHLGTGSEKGKTRT